MDKSRLHPWRRLLLSTTLCCHLCLAAVFVQAHPHFEGEGHVVAVDETQGTVTLNHGPISGLMPAMRMAFPVQQVERLQGLQVGTVVRFSLQARGPEWVIATIEPVEEHPPPRPASFPAPDFTLPTLSGAPIRLAELRGKVVLLNFWATWCVPCRTEMPSLDALYQQYQDRGLAVLAVNVDTLSTAGVEAFMQEVAVTFPIVLDPAWSVARAYRVLGLPTTYLIDRGGNVVIREVGERNWMDHVSQVAVEGLLQ
jgi:thiol-disulfide isomerase/thioredoxin